ncbi:Succinate dehydrogenase flavoprotein subunit [Gardnerella vaginalis]|uniref:succinate dehydrogenase n=1 Tax=Gardnerella vaginalis (strain ATCC 14019 / 317) TaxID=525284 RepID=E3D9A2_GARV3|nr:FAD-binding protein [Gardnerella vaginalis]ADP38646.1 FAD binding domain protein [Gardnerella vaginalis ATCC 14019]KOS09102.1 succinate dehydrogenase [Gardnerella vaginalis]TCH81335.1 FAD-binding protein [Gardnerella vaginalis]TCH82511.1 FAD-binding protein [Gardnerella vaginalis ATCC 14018 = JCM 11026]VEH16858.1 Succinate dehydrogenase flavoprotein subunit [Gardnerella vaginalis]
MQSNLSQQKENTTTVKEKTVQIQVEQSSYDVVIIGAGAAGLSAALGLVKSEEYKTLKSQGKQPKILVICKLQALRSHTGSAEGGIAASLGNIEKDCWQWHYYDTVHGGDWLSDQDAAKMLAKEARDTVIELEHFGVAFSRTEDGHINQRFFGGHTADFGQQPIRRAAYAADRIGHQILYSLWQKCIEENIKIEEDVYVTDLAINHKSNSAEGIIALNEKSGKVEKICARNVLIATGGAGRLFSTTSNSWDLTGDGMSLALNAGLQLEDIEFIQFHPTGLAHTGILLSEAARGEGGVLRNCKNEAFMKNYDDTHADLAPRDVVSRSIVSEIDALRGVEDTTSNIDRKDCVWLDMTRIEKQHMLEALPQVVETIEKYAHLDPSKDLIPIRPTAHYTMGGIPISLNGQVYKLVNNKKQRIIGLYAAGECACSGVHGANRLGGNSLLDACLFGKLSGKSIAKELKEQSQEKSQEKHEEHIVDTSKNVYDSTPNTFENLDKLSENRVQEIIGLIQNTSTSSNTTNPYNLLEKLENIMENAAAVRCSENTLKDALQKIDTIIIPQAKILVLHSQNLVFNQELIAIWELQNMITLAKSVLQASLARHESRGAFTRLDYPKRNNNQNPQHSIVDSSGEVQNIPVIIVDFDPNKPINHQNKDEINKIMTKID